MGEIKKAIILSWLFTILISIVGCWNGIISIIKYWTPAPFDPNLAILTVTLIAIIWYVYWTYKAVVTPIINKDRELNEKKAKLSSALLKELQSLDRAIGYIYLNSAYSYDPFNYPVLKYALMNLHLFNHETVQSISNTYNRTLDLQNYHNTKIDIVNTSSAKNFRLDILQAKAVLARNANNELIDYLIASGGIMPNNLDYIEWKKPDIPQMPKSKLNE